MKRSILILLLIGLVSAGATGAESIKSLKKKQKELQQQMANTNKMLQQTKSEQKTTINKIALLGENIKTQKQLISTIDGEIQALDGQIGKITQKQTQLEADLERIKSDYAKFIRESHFAQMQQSPLLFLLTAEDFQQLVRRVQYMERLATAKANQAHRIEQVQLQLDQQNHALHSTLSDKQNSLRVQKHEQEVLARDERKQMTMLNQLKAQEKNLGAKLQQQQKKAEQLNARIDEMIRKQTQAQTKKGVTQQEKLVSGDFEKNKGRLPWPIEKGHISGQFGKHKHPVHERVMVDNKGLYMQTTAGADCRVVYKGEVTSCFVMGNTYAVIVQHGEYRTVYAGLSSLYVKAGDKVETKQKIGRIYTDPEQDNKTELYFQIYKGRDILNPSNWITH